MLTTTKNNKFKNSKIILITILLLFSFTQGQDQAGECQQNQYFDRASYSCAQCNPKCQECKGTADYCTSCPEGSQLTILTDDSGFKKSQTCKCPKGKRFDPGQGNCVDCTSDCAICNDSQCLKCNDGSVNQATCSPVQDCGEGAYYDGSSCQPCGQEGRCHQCVKDTVNGSGGYCTWCRDLALEKESPASTDTPTCPKSTCPAGHYDIYTVHSAGVATISVESVCFKCTENCEFCDNPKTCQKCFEGYEFTSDMKCERVRPIEDNTWCPRGYFYESGGQKCEKCPERCSLCSAVDTCDLCFTGFDLEGTGCVKPAGEMKGCGIGEYNENGTCKACSSNCVHCEVENSFLKCRQCEEGYLEKIDESNVICEASTQDKIPPFYIESQPPVTPPGSCSLGERDNGGSCEPCPANCAQCDPSSGECQVCRGGYIKHDQDPYLCYLEYPRSICGGGKFPAWNGNTPECRNCPPGCKLCLGDGTCEACARNHQLTPDRRGCFFYPKRYYPYPNNQDNCDMRTYYSESDQNCKQCSTQNCARCPNDSCEKCVNGHKLEGGSCIEDPNLASITISTASDGSTQSGEGDICPLGQGTDADGATSCVECRTMSNDNILGCAKCHKTCLNCYQGFNLIENGGVLRCEEAQLGLTCPEGTRLQYDYNGAQEVLSCGNCWDERCSRCSWSTGECLKCHDGFTMALSSNNNCETHGQLPEDLNQLFVEEEQNNNNNNNNQNEGPPTPDDQGNCPGGYFLKERDSKKYCVACGELCATCSDHTSCTTCRGGFQKNGDSCDRLTPTSDLPDYDPNVSKVPLDACGIGKLTVDGTCIKCVSNCAVCAQMWDKNLFCLAC